MSSRIGKKTYTSPEYAARQLAYAKLPLLKIERPLRHIAHRCYDAVRATLPRNASVDDLALAQSIFNRMMRLVVAVAKAGNGRAVHRMALRYT